MEDQDPQNLLSLDELKIKEDKIQENTPPKLLAWCSYGNNKIRIADLETMQEYTSFDGAKVSGTGDSWTHVKEIPNTNLLVSLNHNWDNSANLEIFDISKKGQAKKVYSLGEVSGFVGAGDVTYNVRRNILGAIPLEWQIAYHLFSIDTNASHVNDIVKLNRKSKWHPHYSDGEENSITGLDFNPMGEKIATIDIYGVCLISDVNTNSSNLDLKMGNSYDFIGRCRWSSNAGEPLLYIKYDQNKINILDSEKKTLILTNPVEPESDWISCIRWSPSGDMLASTSGDAKVKLLDFKTGNVIHTGKTADGSK